MIRKSTERYVELDDLEHPKEIAPDEARKRVRYRLGDPGDNHEGGHCERVLGSWFEIQRSEPQNHRHGDRQDGTDDFCRGYLDLLRSANLRGGTHRFGH